MAPRRVVHDSDDEDGALSPDMSPEKAPDAGVEILTETHISAIQTSGGIIGTSSTDPIFFQAIYDEQRAGFITPIDPNSRDAIPILDDQIINQPMSSSPNAGRTFIKKMPIETSSFTSISEPSASNRKMKRTKSVIALEDLTQVTTPLESKDIVTKATASLEIKPSPSKDPWEFPGSSSGPYLASLSVKSRNALKRNAAVKRTKTMTAVSSKPADYEPPIRSLDDFDTPVDRKRSSRSHGDEDSLPMLPRAKRHKRKISVNGEILTKVDGVVQVSPVLPSDPMDLINPSTSHTSILVPRSATQEDQIARELPISNAGETSELATISCNSIVKQTCSTGSWSSKADDRSASLMIIPNILTDSQKMEYNTITLSSSNPGLESPMPNIVQTAHPRQPAKHLGETKTTSTSCTQAKSHQMEETVLDQSFDTSVPTVNWKIKRSKTETASATQSSKTPTSATEAKIPSRRSKSMTQKQKRIFRELSTDELSLDFPESAGSMTLNPASKAKDKGTAEEPISVDEPFDSAEAEVYMERSQPQPSLRRSKSMKTQAADPKILGDRSPPKRGRPKITNTVSVICSPSDLPEAAADGNADIGDVRTELANSLHECSKEIMETNLNDVLLNPLTESETTSAAHDEPSQPKKRGRKRGVGKAPPQQNPQPPPSTEVPPALQDLDPNPQPPEPSTPSWNRTADFITNRTPTDASNDPPQAKTPVRGPQKGSEQHSPLPSGKFPYRVGLSRKTRIAPLLKIIRKDS